MGKKILKPLILIVIVLAATAFYVFGGKQYLSLDYVQSRVLELKRLFDTYPILILSGFYLIYVGITSMSIPGAIVLTILAGAIFGTGLGTLMVSLASTTGALIAFFLSRFLFRDVILKHMRDRYDHMNEKIESQGTSYLFTLRLFPASPYVVINVIMGVTKMSPWTFAWVTFVGMLPGNALYVFAGREISKINNVSEIMTTQILTALILLSLLPLLGKWWVNHRKGHVTQKLSP